MNQLLWILTLVCNSDGDCGLEHMVPAQVAPVPALSKPNSGFGIGGLPGNADGGGNVVEGGGIAVGEVDARLRVRRRRLDAHSAAFLEWITRSLQLSAAQQVDLQQKLNQQLRQQQERWTRNLHLQKVPLPDYASVRFTMLGGAASFLNREPILLLVEDVLSDEQKILLAEALDERHKAIRAAILDYALAMIDEELFLTVAQRETLSTVLSDSVSNLDDGVFTFSSRHPHLPIVKLLQPLDALPDSMLTDRQRQRLAEAFPQNQAFRANPILRINGTDSIESQVAATSEIVRTRFSSTASLQASWLQHSLELTTEQVNHLSVASIGTAIQCTAEWRHQVQEDLTAIERQANSPLKRVGPNEWVSLRAIPTNRSVLEQLNRNKIWQGAIEKLGADDLIRQRFDSHRAAAIEYVTAMLDKELWLTADQRAQLAAIVDSVCPVRPIVPEWSTEVYRELALKIIPLFQHDPLQKPAVLTKPQLAVLQELQNQL